MNAQSVQVNLCQKLKFSTDSKIVTNAYLIMTTLKIVYHVFCVIIGMQTGFGMVESGSASLKNEVNIIMKNLVNVVLVGFTFWAYGYGLINGKDDTNPYFSTGSWFVDPDYDAADGGLTLVKFIFQLSFATITSTIISGAIAERCNFDAYCLFSLVNTVIFCLPAHWMWAPNGFLKFLGAVDIAGNPP